MLRFFIRLFFPDYSARHHVTVRYAFSFIFIAAIFAGFAAVISQSHSYIKIKTSVESVTQGQQFVIDVVAYAHVPVNAVDIVINYPEDVMVVEGIDTGTSVITLWTENPYAKEGSIYLRGGTFRKGFIGEHTIARIRARAEASGNARVVIQATQLIAGDGKGTEVATNDTSGNVVQIQVVGGDGLMQAKADIAVVSDIDGDGDVDFKDITEFMNAWLTKQKTFDFNGDGRMTIKDFSILLASAFFK